MEEKDKRTETNVEIWKKHQEKEAKGLKKNIYIYFFSNCIVLRSEIDLVAINYLTLPQATGPRNLTNIPRTLYPISGIIKYEEGDFDIGCRFEPHTIHTIIIKIFLKLLNF